MEIEVFEIGPGRWGYRGEGVYQEWHPDRVGHVPMTEAEARACAQHAAAQFDTADGLVTLWTRERLPAITARQIRLALTRAGLRDAVEAAVAASGRDMRDWWEYSTDLHRDNPMVAQMAGALGVTAEQVDAIWELGAGL